MSEGIIQRVIKKHMEIWQNLDMESEFDPTYRLEQLQEDIIADIAKLPICCHSKKDQWIEKQALIGSGGKLREC